MPTPAVRCGNRYGWCRAGAPCATRVRRSVRSSSNTENRRRSRIDTTLRLKSTRPCPSSAASADSAPRSARQGSIPPLSFWKCAGRRSGAAAGPSRSMAASGATNGAGSRAHFLTMDCPRAAKRSFSPGAPCRGPGLKRSSSSIRGCRRGPRS